MVITEPRVGTARTTLLLAAVLVAFAANSLITRHVVGDGLLDAALLSAVRFIAGAVALVGIALARRERPVVGRANLLPALWLGCYAACISIGYLYIGAAAGTFVFYAAVLLTLLAHEIVTRAAVPPRRMLGAAVALAGVALLAWDALGTVTALGVLLLAATGIAWGLYTAAGRTVADPRVATTGHFVVVAVAALPVAGVTAATGVAVSVPGLVWGVAMGAGTTALAYVAWYAAQRSVSATMAGTVQLAIPVLTAVGAVLLLGEPLSPILVVAAALVCCGMAWGASR
ncbi:DMT family transporter [Pseudonocardia sp. GCM10023141]|uniref:DMT family transporter n=1 Tax=Pseudonocardia sp. GCM10023141 TaxID=3252653 RepID=UPI003611C77D